MNKNELFAEMKRFGDTQKRLSECLGITRTTLNAKINQRNKAVFTQTEIMAIKMRYGLAPETLQKIFFNQPVSD